MKDISAELKLALVDVFSSNEEKKRNATIATDGQIKLILEEVILVIPKELNFSLKDKSNWVFINHIHLNWQKILNTNVISYTHDHTNDLFSCAIGFIIKSLNDIGIKANCTNSRSISIDVSDLLQFSDFEKLSMLK